LIRAGFYYTNWIMRRVVVTGMGAVTPLGNNFGESWSNLVRGVSGIAEIDRFDVSGMPFRTAGQVRGLRAEGAISPRERARYDLFVHYAFLAAVEALDDAGWGRKGFGKEGGRVGVVIGSSRAGIASIDMSVRLREREGRRVSAYLMPSTTTSMAASFIAARFGVQGECEGISSACASGLAAIGHACRLIRFGLADIVIAGGTEAPICPVCLEGYGNAGVLSRRGGRGVSSPFDVSRDGFVLSEGACIMVLEALDTALGRGAHIYGEIAGVGNSVDASHQIRPSAEGEAAAIFRAIGDAGVEREKIGFVSAHATSTVLGDSTEAAALSLVFGEKAAEMPVTAIKSMTGHMLAASGAFEAAAAMMVIKYGVVPPTINLVRQDPECPLNISTTRREADVEYAIVNSFGFGGVNAVLVLKKAPL